MTNITVSDIFITVTVIRRLDYERQCKKWCTYRSDLLYLLSLYTPNTIRRYAVVEEKTGGRLSLGAGTLYGALNSLQDKKWIEPYGDSEGRKKEYHITAQGKEIAEKELARLNELVSIASEIIGGAV